MLPALNIYWFYVLMLFPEQYSLTTIYRVFISIKYYESSSNGLKETAWVWVSYILILHLIKRDSNIHKLGIQSAVASEGPLQLSNHDTACV